MTILDNKRRRIITYCSTIIMVLVMSMIWSAQAFAGEQNVTQEYKIKAAYLYNFSLFVDWPAGAAGTDNTSFVICILGQHSFGDALKSMEGKVVKQRVLKVRYISDLKNIGNCQILFVCLSEKLRLPEIIGAAIEKRGILTISDLPGFTRAGGVINLVNVGEKLRFDINMKAARQAGLSMNHQLLNMAHDISN